MSVKRIVAANMQQGLKLISQELGPDAVILSNKRIAGGVEILAATGSNGPAHAPEPEPQAALQPAKPAIPPASSLDKETMASILGELKQHRQASAAPQAAPVAPQIQPAPSPVQADELGELKQEIAALKAMLEQQQAQPQAVVAE